MLWILKNLTYSRNIIQHLNGMFNKYELDCIIDNPQTCINSNNIIKDDNTEKEGNLGYNVFKENAFPQDSRKQET